MSKHKTHPEWVREQFKPTYLKKSYRNVVLHASIIESVLENECEIYSFASANKCLRYSGKITSEEFNVFNEVRKNRNKLVHHIFDKNKELGQDEINKLIDSLIKKIHESYRISNFLNEKLFKKYRLRELSGISFEQVREKIAKMY